MADGKLGKAVFDLTPEIQAQIDALVAPADEAPEGTAVAEAPAPVSEAPPSDSGAEAEVETAESVAETEAPQGTETVAEYFGVDLSDIPEDARQGLIDELRERDNLINRLLRERAEGEPAPVEVAADEEVELTDEDILRALGQDPEYVDPTSAQALVTLGRQLVEAESRINAMAERAAVQETMFFWESSLDKLEAEHGALPVPRETLLQFAANSNIGDPALAYWAIVGPTRSEVSAEVKKRRVATAAEKAAASTLRPAAASDLIDAELTSKDNKSAVKEAALKVLKDMGLN